MVCPTTRAIGRRGLTICDIVKMPYAHFVVQIDAAPLSDWKWIDKMKQTAAYTRSIETTYIAL